MDLWREDGQNSDRKILAKSPPGPAVAIGKGTNGTRPIGKGTRLGRTTEPLPTSVNL
jgi:hypothetical protein